MRVEGLGFRVEGLGFGTLGFRVSGLGGGVGLVQLGALWGI